jgi:hypothetical protein
MIFTEKWSNIIFPYKEKSPPDSSFIKYLDSLDNFTMPCINKINSQFGYRKSGFHKGIDIHLTKGDEVKVIFNGIVRYARFNSGGYGNLVIVRHFNGLETCSRSCHKVITLYFDCFISLIDEKKQRIVWCGMLTSTKRKELIKTMLHLQTQTAIDGSNTILQLEQPNFHWKSMKDVEKEIDLRSKECRDCGSPFEIEPYDRGIYQGDNEPVVFVRFLENP